MFLMLMLMLMLMLVLMLMWMLIFKGDRCAKNTVMFCPQARIELERQLEPERKLYNAAVEKLKKQLRFCQRP